MICCSALFPPLPLKALAMKGAASREAADYISAYRAE